MYEVPGLSWILYTSKVKKKKQLNQNESWQYFFHSCYLALVFFSTLGNLLNTGAEQL